LLISEMDISQLYFPFVFPLVLLLHATLDRKLGIVLFYFDSRHYA
jgi:hypothetical protein